MRNLLFLAAWLLLPSLFPLNAPAQKKIIVVIGSSTAAGDGATTLDSDYVSIVKRYYQALHEVDTIYDLGLPGSTTFFGMPTSFSNYGSQHAPMDSFNVTAALDQYHADVVLVNYPTNDLAGGISMTQFLSNLQAISDTVFAAGKVCYVTTTQPRDAEPAWINQLLFAGRDSVLNAFPVYGIDFYTAIVAADSISINPIYAADSTHVNNAGHAVLAQVVINKSILPAAPLALTLTDFSAVAQQGSVLISWTDQLEEPNTVFGIQRSADGSVFPTIADVNGQGGARSASMNYTWTDEAPLNGRSYYRLKIIQGSATTYSGIVTMVRVAKNLSIVTVYQAGRAGLFTADINTGKNQTALIRIVNAAGSIVWQQSHALVTPTTRLTLDLTRFAKGAYFLQVTAADGEEAIRGFPDF